MTQWWWEWKTAYHSAPSLSGPETRSRDQTHLSDEDLKIKGMSL